MLENAIIAAISVILGIIIANIFDHAEISHLKNQLFDAEEENDKLLRENSGLREHNSMLYDKLYELHKVNGISTDNIPNFDEW